jgi:hypothetical protein
MTDRAYAKLIDGADPGKGDGGTDARRSRSCSLKLGDVARCSERSQRRIESEFGIVSSARSKNAPEEISASETNVNAGALGDMSARTAVAPTSRSRVHAAMIENAASTALSFDFMTITPLDEPPRPPPAWLLQLPRQLLAERGFLDNRWLWPRKAGAAINEVPNFPEAIRHQWRDAPTP